MPVLVDGSQRRADVVREAIALVVGGGLNALTFRNLAAALGCSTTVVSHHFRGNDDLLLETYRAVTEQAVARRDRSLAASGGSLLVAVEDLLPVDEVQRRHWIVWMCFWSSALFAPTLAAEHRDGLAGTRERLRDHIAARGSAYGAEDAAQTLCAALFGIAVQALFDPAYWTPERQRATFRRAVDAAIGRTPDPL